MVLRLVVLALLDAAALVGLRPHPGALVRHLSSPDRWLRADVDRACVEICGAALWLVAAWLAVGLLVTAAGAGSGRVSTWADALGRRLFPAAGRRLLAAALGTGLALAPATAAASPAGAGTSAVAAAPTPGWPVDPTGPAWPSDGHRAGTPPWAHPRSTQPPSAQPPPNAPSRHHHPPHTTTPHPKRVRTATPGRSSAGAVTVRSGDSLWLIAQRRLGPDASPAQVAAEWPRWYAANRATVGPDPALIRPGQTLHDPTDTH